MHSHALRTTEPGRQRVRQAPEPVSTHFCVLVLSLSGYTRFRRLMRTEISSYARLSHSTTEGNASERATRSKTHRAAKGWGMTIGPTPFEVHESGALLHGTKADLAIGDLLMAGHVSNFESGRVMNHVYVTETLDAAAWGAELALGDGPGRIYVVEPTGSLEDDPNVTDKKFSGNPTRSYRTREPVRVVGELNGWTGHTPEQLQAMKDGLAGLRRRGAAVIYD